MPTDRHVRQPGRPPLYEGETTQIAIRLSQDDYDWLGKESVRQGRTGRAAIIRRLITAERDRQEKKSTPK